MKDNKIFLKRKDESFDEYAHRISSLREEYNLNWTQVANIINVNTGNNFSGDKYRKQEKKLLKKKLYDMYKEESGNNLEEFNDTKPSKLDTVVAKKLIDSYNVTPFDKEVITSNFEKGEVTSSKEIALSEEQIKNPDDLLKAHGYSAKDWDIKTATNTKTSRTTPNGEYYYYSSRITIKPKAIRISDIEYVKDCLNDFNISSASSHFKTNNITKSSDETLVIPLYDLHFGRLPDVENFVKYDINEEKAKIISHVYKYISKFNGRTFKRIYLILGQDFLNSSFTGYTSSQSHLQSNAVDFRTMLRAGSELLISIIDLFANISNDVNVIGSLGNHDVSEESALFLLLSAYYRNIKNVTVNDSLAPRKYEKIGNACVGFGHLDKENKRAFGLMQIEAKDIWAVTKCHIYIAGHLHHFSVSSENGVEIYRVPSICEHDRWTNENGYVMNEPKTMCFVFNEEDGLIETHFMYL